jgi:hypothetical protein
VLGFAASTEGWLDLAARFCGLAAIFEQGALMLIARSTRHTIRVDMWQASRACRMRSVSMTFFRSCSAPSEAIYWDRLYDFSTSETTTLCPKWAHFGKGHESTTGSAG